MAHVSYEGLDNKEEVETLLAGNENHNNKYNVVSNSESDEKAEENHF